ncbi:nucleotidyltransferase [Aeromicrobium sp. Leaf350]|uniref:nucleotidyltransferase domain-containing protein n=1 Tax=Aeromicrobium sp. Leaf350 TaxID=2876565 RepID=UPI001E42A922|nr:nucleotidyltransferase [Aeromicrobium sp. Leaf350]
METLHQQFEDAVRNVTLHGEKAKRAQEAHIEVRKLLESDTTLKEWGVDSVLIGSYARQTARYPGKDVDIFLRLQNRTNRHDPEIIYEQVRNVLVNQYGDIEAGGRVTEQPRSLKVDFANPNLPADQQFSVDAVPAVRWGDSGHWGIPNRDRDLWRADESRWIQTNPVQFATETNALAVSAATPIVAGTNAYRPVVRLMRQVRHVHLGDARPGGLAFEVASFHAWNSSDVLGDSYAELLISTFDAVAAEFRSAVETGLADPVFGTRMQPELSSDQWNGAAWRLEDLARQGREALESSKCRAAKIWRDILGTNDRGPVLPLPDGCDAAGFAIGAVTAVGSVGSNDPRGFA